MESELYKVAIGALVSVISVLATALVVLWKLLNKRTELLIELSSSGGGSNATLEKVLALVEMYGQPAGRKKSSNRPRD